MKIIIYVMLFQKFLIAESLNCYVCQKENCEKPSEKMETKSCDGECCWSKHTPKDGVKVPSASGAQEETHFTEKSCCSEPTKAKYIDKMCYRLLNDPKVVHCYSCTSDLCNGPASAPPQIGNKRPEGNRSDRRESTILQLIVLLLGTFCL